MKWGSPLTVPWFVTSQVTVQVTTVAPRPNKPPLPAQHYSITALSQRQSLLYLLLKTDAGQLNTSWNNHPVYSKAVTASRQRLHHC